MSIPFYSKSMCSLFSMKGIFSQLFSNTHSRALIVHSMSNMAIWKLSKKIFLTVLRIACEKCVNLCEGNVLVDRWNLKNICVFSSDSEKSIRYLIAMWNAKWHYSYVFPTFVMANKLFASSLTNYVKRFCRNWKQIAEKEEIEMHLMKGIL